MRKIINMRSAAHTVKGQGVGSAYEEQVALIKKNLSEKYEVHENDLNVKSDITHYHTVNLPYFLSFPFVRNSSVMVGYVHFLPETVEQSIKLPFIAKYVFYKYILWFYKSCDYLVTVNPYFIDCLEEYGVKREKVSYIPNYVDDKKFFPMEKTTKLRAFEKFKLNPDKFTVVCAGQLQTRKGVVDFVECARRLPDIQFVWAGGFSFGRIGDGYSEIKKIVEEPPENMRFLGIIDREDMNALYNIGDVMFLPSFEELFPMTILEAMNCKKPILLRDIPIYENILFDYYLRADDVDGFVKAIEKLSQDEEHYKESADLSWKGHLFYNKENVIKMWDEFYSSVLEEKTPKRIAKRNQKKF